MPSELVARKAELGTDDFVAYTAAYVDHVIVVEYRQADLDAGCSTWPALSIVLRDRQLVTPMQSGYAFDGC